MTGWPSDVPGDARVLIDRWRLGPGEPLRGEPATCAWVTGVTRADGTPAVLKLADPHFEAADEARGLRHWDGDPTVRLLDEDPVRHALLLERCEPGTPLRREPPDVQDRVISDVLRRLWQRPIGKARFRPLAEMLAYWGDEVRARRETWRDPGLVKEGLRCFDELGAPRDDDVLLATDLHAGNVLRATRSRWLAIDPKPFVGDRAYDVTQHLLNVRDRLHADPIGTVDGVSDGAGLDRTRVRTWLFARLAVEVGERGGDAREVDVVHALRPR